MTSGVFGLSGVMVGMPCNAANSATLSNQMVSFGLSRCVTTSATSTPCANNTDRQRTPTLWYANTTALLIAYFPQTKHRRPARRARTEAAPTVARRLHLHCGTQTQLHSSF